MIIYKCRFTGDEMLTDAFRPRPVVDDEGNEVPGLIELDSQMVNKVRSIECCGEKGCEPPDGLGLPIDDSDHLQGIMTQLLIKAQARGLTFALF
jgi:hypothetical protein